MFIKIIFTIALLTVGVFVTLDWLSLFSRLKSVKNAISVILAGLLGPLGMFYWGIWIGFASILGIITLLIPWSFLGLPINGWFHLVRTLVFLWMSLKINSLTGDEKISLKKIDFKNFLYLIWQNIQGFLLYGFIVYLLWKILS